MSDNSTWHFACPEALLDVLAQPGGKRHLAVYLILAQETASGDLPFDLPLAHLAERVGSQRIAVAASLRWLAASGLVTGRSSPGRPTHWQLAASQEVRP
jgi:predicted transcriptional regulator